MHTHKETIHINRDHFELLADNGEHIALITAHNLDEDMVVGAYSYHRYNDTYAVEHAYPSTSEYTDMSVYHELFVDGWGLGEVVSEHLDGLITDQRLSDDETRFTWHLEYAVDSVLENDTVSDLLDVTVEPDRLEPDFDIPEDEAVTILDIGHDEHEIVKQANSRYGWSDLEFHRHRGQSYIIGLTEDRAKRLSNYIHDLKLHLKDGEHFEAVELADRVEGVILNSEPVNKEEA